MDTPTTLLEAVRYWKRDRWEITAEAVRKWAAAKMEQQLGVQA